MLAVSKISEMIARCPRLKSFITTNDKTPFTDGHIDMHAGLQQSNADWLGRVPVQVKGRSRGSKKALSKYPVKRTDLIAYQKDSGVLYFVVTVDPRTSRCTPYYALLSPFKIQDVLDGAPSRDRIPVSLTRLENSPSSIERIVGLALKTRDQKISTGFDPVLFEHAQSFTVHTASELNFDAPVTLTPGSSDFALVLNTTDGLSIPLPGELHILPPEYAKRALDLQVRSGEISYRGIIVKRIDEDSFEAEISDGLTLTFRSVAGTHYVNLSLTPERTLEARLKAFKFYAALLNTQAIYFGEELHPLAIEDPGESSTSIREQIETLEFLAELFTCLEVDSRLIDLDQIQEAEARQLRVLHRAFVGEEEVAGTAPKISVAHQQIGKWRLTLLVLPGREPGMLRLTNPFSAETRCQFRWNVDGGGLEGAVPATAYDLVDAEHLGSTLNLNLTSIVGAYEAIADFPSTYGFANQRVVDLLTTADTNPRRRDEFLDAAARLNDWLVAEEGERPHHQINRAQILWRRGTLAVEQRDQIRALKHKVAHSDDDHRDQLELACALLLGERDEVEYLVQQLAEDQLAQMQGWPIWRLHGSESQADF